MNEGATLYLLLWLLYLSECFIWVRKQSVAFVSPWHKQWSVVAASSFLANSRGGALLLNPFFPATRVLVCSLSPVSISPGGICAFNGQSFLDRARPVQNPHYFAFDEIQSCTRNDRRIMVNKVAFADCADLAESQRLEVLINKAVHTAAAQRQLIVRQFIVQRFAKAEALDVLGKALAQLRSLEILCSIFFPLLFILVPVLALRYSLEEVIIPAAILMIGFAVAIASLFYYHHKSLWPASSAERFSIVAKIILCPPGAIRAVGHFTANIVSAYDPVVIASLLPPDEMKRFISAYVRDLQFSLKDELDAPAKEIAQWYRAEISSQVMDYVKTRTKLRPEMILAPPILETGCNSYCPRCHSQFTTSDGECSDCDGVRLICMALRNASATGADV